MSRLPLGFTIFDSVEFERLLPVASGIFLGHCREAVVKQVDLERQSELKLFGFRASPEEGFLRGVDSLVPVLSPDLNERIKTVKMARWEEAQEIISGLNVINLSMFYSDFRKHGLSKCVERWSDVAEGTPLQT